MPLRRQSPRDGRPWDLGFSPHSRPHCGPLDDGGQFCQTVGDVTMLIAKSLTGYDQLPISGEPRSLLLFKPRSYLRRQVRRIPHGQAEHGFAARAIDMLAAGTSAPGKLPVEGSSRNDDGSAGQTKRWDACHAHTLWPAGGIGQRQHASIPGRGKPRKTVIWTVRARPLHTFALPAVDHRNWPD
jgi:hypothetical protein